jgi:hypothetical protein
MPRTSFGAAAFAAVVLSGCGPTSLFSAPPPRQPNVSDGSAVIPLTIGTPMHDARPMIVLKVGDGPPSRFIVDTGSFGLRVFRGALGPNVYDTGITVPDSQFGGSAAEKRIYRGTLGMGPVDVGGITIPQAAFEIVHDVCTGTSCNPDGEPLNVGGGIFGVEVTSGPSQFRSLMSQLPGNLGSGFIISLSDTLNPSMTVGITPANSAGFTTQRFLGKGKAQAIGFAPTADRFTWCYSIRQSTLQDACIPEVVTDSGGEAMILSFLDVPAPRLFPVSGTLAPGLTVDAKLGRITWTFTTGTCLHFDRVDVQFSGAPEPAAATNSTNPFYMNDVMYDLRDGLFGMRPTSPSARPSFCG